MLELNFYRILGGFIVASLLSCAQGKAQIIVNHVQKISSNEGGLPALLDNNDHFGSSVSPIGDLDNNGVSDLIVGAMNDDDGGVDRGALYILYLNADHTVKSYKKISTFTEGFDGNIRNYDRFGIAADAIGDIDGDGNIDIAVGANYDSETTHQGGAVWILFLNQDGSVKKSQKINSFHGNFNRSLPSLASFGSSICSLGDLNGDGVNDIAVGAYRDNSMSSSKSGALYILFLKSDGTVKSSRKISESENGFTGSLDPDDYFGGQVAPIGDLNNDGTLDLAVSAFKDSDGGTDKGAVWILFLNSDGSVKSFQKVSSNHGNFTGTLEVGDFFGASLVSLGDINNDGIPDLAVGADRDNDGGTSKGAVWILYLRNNGSVKDFMKISDTEGCFSGYLKNGDYFGGSIAVVSNTEAQGIITLAVGAVLDDDGGENRGSIYIINLDNPKAPDAGEDKYVCEASVFLNAVVPESKFNSQWTVINGSAKVLEPNNPKTKVVDLSEDKNTFIWTISNGTCELKDTVDIFFEKIDGEFSAGSDQQICKSETYLEATKPNDVTGEWVVHMGEGHLSDVLDPFTEVKELSPGENKFIWTIKNSNCSLSDTVSILYDASPVQIPTDEDQLTCTNNIVLNPTFIHEYSNSNWEVLYGGAVILNQNEKSLEVIELSAGENIFQYAVNECRSYLLKVVYNPINIAHLTNVITPNGDGANDFLYFPNIEDYPKSQLTIVNRWGKVVFETTNYSNNWKGNHLETGIYYYRLQIEECMDFKSTLHILK